MHPFLAALALGAVYEASAVVWAVAAVRHRASLAALASAVCAACLLAGASLALHDVRAAAGYVAGYALGTWLAVRLGAPRGR